MHLGLRATDTCALVCWGHTPESPAHASTRSFRWNRNHPQIQQGSPPLSTDWRPVSSGKIPETKLERTTAGDKAISISIKRQESCWGPLLKVSPLPKIPAIENSWHPVIAALGEGGESKVRPKSNSFRGKEIKLNRKDYEVAENAKSFLTAEIV